MIRFDDADRIFAEGGAMEAFWRPNAPASSVTSASPDTRTPRPPRHPRGRARQGFAFDTVQMPLNVMDAHFRSSRSSSCPSWSRRESAVLGMKSHGRRRDPRQQGRERHRVPPLRAESADVGRNHGHRQSRDPGQAMEAARRFRPLSAGEVGGLLARTADAASRGQFELFKTSSVFDATALNPDWLAAKRSK